METHAFVIASLILLLPVPVSVWTWFKQLARRQQVGTVVIDLGPQY